MGKKWDVFISHASEDKESVVRPLAKSLSAFGVRVWYDEFTLDIGDSLSRTIDIGLAESKYGIVVLSSSFFSKKWPGYELQGLVAKEIGYGKTILPIWHSVTREDVLKYSPPLADKVALQIDKYSPLQAALRIIKVIRPDILTRVHQRIAYLQLMKLAKPEKRGIEKIAPAPIHYKELSKDLIGRVRLIRAALWNVYPRSMEFWLDGFRRDLHPSDEIARWEHIAACYMEYTEMVELNPEQKEHVFGILLGFSIGFGRDEMAKYIPFIPEGDFGNLEQIAKYTLPLYDTDEKFPDVIGEVPTETLESLAQIFDIDEFDKVIME